MMSFAGRQLVHGLGNTQLSIPGQRRRCLPRMVHNPLNKSMTAQNMIRRPAKPFPQGLGVGQLPKRPHISRKTRIDVQATSSSLGREGGWINKVPMVLKQQPQKVIQRITEKLKASSEEWMTFLPMALLFFTMAFVNTIVNNLSMTLVITAPGGGAGVIPFLTSYAAFPLTIGATVLYAYASHYISHKKLFTITVGLFAAFNLVFAMCLLPNHEALHLPGVADTLAKVLPSGLSGAVGMVRNWTFSIFYCLSEMWGDMGISLLFWGFANDITTSKQAPILYPLMGIGANIAQTLGGIVLKMLSVGSAAAYGSRLQYLLFQIVGCMMLVLTLHHFIASRTERKKQEVESHALPSLSQPTKRVQGKVQNSSPSRKFVHASAARSRTHDVKSFALGSLKNQIADGVCGRHIHRPPHYIHKPDDRRVSSYDLFASKGTMLEASFRKKLPIRALGKLPLINVQAPTKSCQNKAAGAEKGQVHEEKEKPSFMQSMKTLTSSPVVKSLGVMTIAQALSVTLMEFVWRSHLKLAYPTPAAFSAFMGDVATVIGIATGGMMVFSPILFNKIGWKGVASITPVLMTIGGCAFFALCSAFHIFGQMGMTALAQKILPMTVMGGAFLFVLSRGTKFSLFKPSEEMVYIKMDESQRTKGKAAVDVVGANVGKSGGSVLQQMLLLASGGHLLFITPVMFAVYMFMMRGWNRAVATLAPFQDTKESQSAPEQADPHKSELKSVPLEKLEDIEEARDVGYLTENLVPWEEDRESIGSSVVEFNPLDHDDWPSSHDNVHSYPLSA